jgi:iron(III) transport system substrate-binding protein
VGSQRKEEVKMFKNGKLLVMIGAIGFLMGIFLLMGTFSVVQGKELPADVEKWLKKNKIGPYQEDTVDYDALYQAAKKEGRVVVYSYTSRGPKSLAMGFYDKYPGIKVEWINIHTATIINRLISEQKAGIYNVDIITATANATQVNVLHPSNMIFPWVPPDLKKVIPRKFQEPLLGWQLTGNTLFYNTYTWPDKPPIDSWWDITKPEWKGRLVFADPRVSSGCLDFLVGFVNNAEEMEKEYERVFGKPLKLTTPNAGYEFIKMVYANKPKLVKNVKDARYIGKPGQEKPSLGVAWPFPRITDTDNPKYGKIKLAPHLTLKPKIGLLSTVLLNIAYKAPHPNAAKLMVRWLFGDEKGGAGFTPWFTPGSSPVRTDIKKAAPHPFNPKLSYNLMDLNVWYANPYKAFKNRKKVLAFINRLL